MSGEHHPNSLAPGAASRYDSAPAMFNLVPTDLSPGALAFLLASAFVAALARGFSGFGAALIFLPLAATVVDPKVASPLLLVTDAVLAVGFIPNAWRTADKREVGIMSVGAAIGIPLGTLLLVRLDPLIIRWGIVVLATAMLTLLVSGWRYRGQPTTPLTFGVGGFAGVCSGAAQVGGPAVIAYWLGSHSPAALIRANIILYFAVSTAIAMIAYYFGGVMTVTVLKLCLVVGPIYALGLFIGARLFGIADESVFRRICYALIAVAVLISLPLLDGVIR
jgi:uncharacterized membrane protein YfcA